MLSLFDLTPLSQAEIDAILIKFQDIIPDPVWFEIGCWERKNTIAIGIRRGDHLAEHYSDKALVCAADHPSRWRYCTRAKNHIGPHVSGVTRLKEALIWTSADTD